MQEEPQSQPPKQSFGLAIKWGWVNLLIVCLFSLISIAILPFLRLKTQSIKADSVQSLISVEENPSLITLPSFQSNTFLPISEPFSPKIEKPVKKIRVIVTAYSSTPWQTDDTPFITASGTIVRDGVVAANFLPFGTEIRIPALYGEKTFVVEDRMHPRNYYNVDIWLPSYQEAVNFGAIRTYIEVLEG